MVFLYQKDAILVIDNEDNCCGSNPCEVVDRVRQKFIYITSCYLEEKLDYSILAPSHLDNSGVSGSTRDLGTYGWGASCARSHFANPIPSPAK